MYPGEGPTVVPGIARGVCGSPPTRPERGVGEVGCMEGGGWATGKEGATVAQSQCLVNRSILGAHVVPRGALMELHATTHCLPGSGHQSGALHSKSLAWESAGWPLGDFGSRGSPLRARMYGGTTYQCPCPRQPGSASWGGRHSGEHCRNRMAAASGPPTTQDTQARDTQRDQPQRHC